MSAGRCKKGFLYDAYASDSNNNCIGATNKYYPKDESDASTACDDNFEGSNLATGSMYCDWSFRSFLKVLNEEITFESNIT